MMVRQRDGNDRRFGIGFFNNLGRAAKMFRPALKRYNGRGRAECRADGLGQRQSLGHNGAKNCG